MHDLSNRITFDLSRNRKGLVVADFCCSFEFAGLARVQATLRSLKTITLRSRSKVQGAERADEQRHEISCENLHSDPTDLCRGARRFCGDVSVKNTHTAIHTTEV
ncbi:hypothetical protein AAFF_G00067940 [Aldrovandia affinis]|uniref:Uncharacterized protein n=1 Tax=Aldrovandia affinis TaxID=143900 RepID=A0AAD7S1S2_9TELE|nr:hypothetical protein AAFF_G00067940 [Aldrovandia affinis]